jgi:hypothetical protein
MTDPVNPDDDVNLNRLHSMALDIDPALVISRDTFTELAGARTLTDVTAIFAAAVLRLESRLVLVFGHASSPLVLDGSGRVPRTQRG